MAIIVHILEFIDNQRFLGNVFEVELRSYVELHFCIILCAGGEIRHLMVIDLECLHFVELGEFETWFSYLDFSV